MKLTNYTNLDSQSLRSVICAVHTAEGKRRGKRLHTWNKDLTIDVVHSQERTGERGYSGYASIHGYFALLRIPHKSIPCNLHIFGGLWRHELWHLYGIRHKDFPRSIMWFHENPPTPFLIKALSRFDFENIPVKGT